MHDAKRGDIGNTTNKYACTFFKHMNFDAVPSNFVNAIESTSWGPLHGGANQAPKIARYAPNIVLSINLYHIDKLKNIPKNKFASISKDTTRNPLSS